MLETLRKIFPAVRVHPHKPIHSWATWQQNDPQLAELKDFEHGIVRRLSAEMVHANGLILDYADRGAATWRVQ